MIIKNLVRCRVLENKSVVKLLNWKKNPEYITSN